MLELCFIQAIMEGKNTISNKKNVPAQAFFWSAVPNDFVLGPVQYKGAAWSLSHWL